MILHGVKFGKGMKTIAVPRYSKGILMIWPEGKTGFSLSEHNSDAYLNLEHFYLRDAEETCHIYFYGYVLYNQEDGQLPARITRRTSQQDDRLDSSREQIMDVEAASSEDHKRKGPDSRTVVLAPEKKPLVLKGSRPCGGVRRARMQRELFLQQHGLQ